MAIYGEGRKTRLQISYTAYAGTVTCTVGEEFIRSYNFHALIILEGFDELPDHCRNDQSLFSSSYIAGKMLPLVTVLVTSQPLATKKIHQNYEIHW